MRKITLVLTLVAFAAFVFAQTSPKVMYKDHAATKSDVSFVTHKITNDTKGEAPDWYVNFEESSPVWTVGHESGTTDWFVGGAAQVPDGPNGWGDYEEGWYFFPLGDYSETGNEVGGNWAMLDIIGLFFAGAQEDGEYWIRFDNIDLSNNNAPKLVFYQLFRPLNSVNGYIDFSLDGGNTWTATVEPNEGVDGNDYGSVRKEMLVGEYIGGQSNVSMRFRWVTSIGSPTAPHGYGWQLDDLMIIDAPEHDLKLIKAHMNFFDYFDYTEYEDHRGFHYSTHYGHATKKEYESEHAVMLFNPIIENKGLNAAIPTVNISVIDPNGDEIYNETQVFGTIASGSIDTLDFLVPELHIANPHFGEYTVLYEVSEDGVEDYNDNDNWDYVNFRITENLFAKDLGNMTGRVGPSNWMSGGIDGEQLGTEYLFLYETEITAIEVYVGANSTPGTSMMGYIYGADGEAWNELASTAFTDVEEEHVDNWVTLPLADIASVDLGGYEGASILVALEFVYNDPDNNLYIGSDNSAPTSIYGASWKFDGDDDFGYIGNWSPSSLGLRLITNDSSDEIVAAFSANKTNVTEGDEIKFTSLSVGATEYEWTFEGGDPLTSPNQNPIVTYNTEGTFDVTLQVTGPNGTDTKVMEDYINVMGVKISENAMDAIRVYPNPATDVLNVDVQNLQSLRVYNTVGQVVFEGNVNTIDVSSWTNGWYVLEVRTMDNVIRTNIVVQ